MRRLLSLLVGFVLVASACGGGSSGGSGTSAAASTTPAPPTTVPPSSTVAVTTAAPTTAAPTTAASTTTAPTTTVPRTTARPTSTAAPTTSPGGAATTSTAPFRPDSWEEFGVPISLASADDFVDAWNMMVEAYEGFGFGTGVYALGANQPTEFFDVGNGTIAGFFPIGQGAVLALERLDLTNERIVTAVLATSDDIDAKVLRGLHYAFAAMFRSSEESELPTILDDVGLSAEDEYSIRVPFDGVDYRVARTRGYLVSSVAFAASTEFFHENLVEIALLALR